MDLFILSPFPSRFQMTAPKPPSLDDILSMMTAQSDLPQKPLSSSAIDSKHSSSSSSSSSKQTQDRGSFLLDSFAQLDPLYCQEHNWYGLAGADNCPRCSTRALEGKHPGRCVDRGPPKPITQTTYGIAFQHMIDEVVKPSPAPTKPASDTSADSAIALHLSLPPPDPIHAFVSAHGESISLRCPKCKRSVLRTELFVGQKHKCRRCSTLMSKD